MNVRDFSRYLLNYWGAANAPEPLFRMQRVLRMPAAQVRHALLQLAGTPDPDITELGQMAECLATDLGRETCDEILASKKPPKTWAELVERNYKAQQQLATDRVRSWIKQELADH